MIGSRHPASTSNLGVERRTCRRKEMGKHNLATQTLLDNSTINWHNSNRLGRVRRQRLTVPTQPVKSHITMCCTGAAGRAAIA